MVESFRLHPTLVLLLLKGFSFGDFGGCFREVSLL